MIKKAFFILVVTVPLVLLYAFSSKWHNNSSNISKIVTKDAGIKFMEANWANALKEAQKQNKLIFLDAYTSWCGPCKMLKSNTFTDKEAGEFYNKNFINVAIDMEKGDGPSLAGKYGVNAYPTLIFADASGKMVAYTKGYIDAIQLIEFGKFGLSKK